MNKVRSALKWLAAGLGLGVGTYLSYAAGTWIRYGHIRRHSVADDCDPLLDRFMPAYEVVERHEIPVTAPAVIAFSAATEIDLTRSSAIQAIFKIREFVLCAQPSNAARPRALIAQMKSLGWGVLAEIPEHEIVMGAVTQPWMANVVMRAIPPDQFADFHEPGNVKIAWTLRADPVGPAESVVRTETRVVTTDATARGRFRRYWSLVSPGVVLIRKIALRLVKRQAERNEATITV